MEKTVIFADRTEEEKGGLWENGTAIETFYRDFWPEERRSGRGE